MAQRRDEVVRVDHDFVPVVAHTPEPPYVAVIFSSRRTSVDDGYDTTAAEMESLASRQPGYLGFESARGPITISVSYWRTTDDAIAWKMVSEHVSAQRRGRDEWYESYTVRVAVVQRDYEFRARTSEN